MIDKYHLRAKYLFMFGMIFEILHHALEIIFGVQYIWPTILPLICAGIGAYNLNKVEKKFRGFTPNLMSALIIIIIATGLHSNYMNVKLEEYSLNVEQKGGS